MAPQPKTTIATQRRPTGMPPWHAVLFLGLVVLLSVAFLPSAADLDDTVAVRATFARRLFPQYLSLSGLFLFRVACALFIFLLSLQNLLLAFSPQPVCILVPYLPQSKLQRGKRLALRGFFSQAPFTLWAWNLLGLSFAVNAYLTHAVLADRDVSPVALRAGVLLFEMAAPLTLLVAAVVKYALWPQALKQGTGTDALKSFRALSFHNVNVVMAVTEVTLTGGLPLRATDASLAALFGAAYVVFAWAIARQWQPAAGPQYLYFFLDPTLGAMTTVILLLLFLVFLLFYALFGGLHHLVVAMDRENDGGAASIDNGTNNSHERSFMAHALAFVLVCASVCRLRD